MGKQFKDKNKFKDISFLMIEGDPIPAARPRKGKYGFYNSQSKLVEKIRQQIFLQKDNWYEMSGPLFMRVLFRLGFPKSTSKKKMRALQGNPHTKKPDLSNLIKFIEDVLNGIIYKDDKQICKIYAKKEWNTFPHTIIEINHYEKSEFDTFFFQYVNKSL